MPSDRSNRFSSAGRRGRDGWRALIAFIVVMALFGLIGTQAARAPAVSTAAPPQSDYGDDELRTGSILFVPVLGNHCRKRAIDNATWQIRDDGVVNCDTALSQPARPRPHAWSTARVGVIRDGFRRK